MEKKLNIATFFLLPLIDSTTSFSDYTKAGFINLYTDDINRPYINDKIFLVFNSAKLRSSNLFSQLKSNSLFYNDYSIRVKGEWCAVLVFIKPINHKYEISVMQKTPQLITYTTKITILNYWQLDINSLMHKALFDGFEIKNFYQHLPEEDLIFKNPADEILFEEEVDTK